MREKQDSNGKMVLEATIIVIDNSEYMRNGDYLTSRYQAQLDTVELIFRRKTQANPESMVGLLTMAGESTRVVSNLTTDYGELLSGVHEAKIDGQANLINGIEVACLALKNRQNKNQRQRVVVFVGSPITASDSTLDALARKLKKASVAVDFINFGEEQLNTAKLERSVSIANTNSSSHLVTVPPGPYLLYDQVEKSPILREQDSSSSGNAAESSQNAHAGASSGGAADDFGLDDPNMDPELALAIRLSLEEERARQQKASQGSKKTEGKEKLETVDEKDDKKNGKKNDEKDDDKMDETK